MQAEEDETSGRPAAPPPPETFPQPPAQAADETVGPAQDETIAPRTQLDDGPDLHMRIMGQVLRGLRERARVAQSDLANEVGLSKTVLSRGELGREFASRSTVLLYEYFFRAPRFDLRDLRDDLDNGQHDLARLRAIELDVLPVRQNARGGESVRTSRARRLERVKKIEDEGTPRSKDVRSAGTLSWQSIDPYMPRSIRIVKRLFPVIALIAALLIASAIANVALFLEPGPIADYSSPGVAGCLPDSHVRSSVVVYNYSRQLVGILDLRTSDSCKAAWGRFTPISPSTAGGDLTVTFILHRGKFTASSDLELVSDGKADSKTLYNYHECVWVEATVTQNGQKLGDYHTDCEKTYSHNLPPEFGHRFGIDDRLAC